MQQKKPAPIPPGYHAITPFLVVKECARAMEFYAKAFGAEVEERYTTPDGSTIVHAQMRIGDSPFMLADAMGEWGPTQSLMQLYVEDCDAVFERAVAAGATVLRPLANQFYGDRSGQLGDRFGQKWSISTHLEDVSPEEMERRMKSFGG